MRKMYSLEAYSYEGDYWRKVGDFYSFEVANSTKTLFEKKYPYFKFDIVEFNVIEVLEELNSKRIVL